MLWHEVRSWWERVLEGGARPHLQGGRGCQDGGREGERDGWRGRGQNGVMIEKGSIGRVSASAASLA